MPIAQKARRAGVLVRQLVTGGDPQSAISELAGMYPTFRFMFETDSPNGLTVLVPSCSRMLNGQLLIPSALMRGAHWIIEVSEDQLTPHKIRDDHGDEVVRQFQKAVGLATDGIIGAATKAAMRQIAAGVPIEPAVPAPEPERPSRWTVLMSDDD